MKPDKAAVENCITREVVCRTLTPALKPTRFLFSHVKHVVLEIGGLKYGIVREKKE